MGVAPVRGTGVRHETILCDLIKLWMGRGVLWEDGSSLSAIRGRMGTR
jgi:hypothetical protein